MHIHPPSRRYSPVTEACIINPVCLQERWSWSYRNSSEVQRLRDAYQLGRALSEWQLPQLQQLPTLRRPADVLLADYCLNDAALLVAWHLLQDSSEVPREGPALVLLSPEAALPRWVLRAAGGPPTPLLHRSFFQRLRALALAVFDHHRYYWRHLAAERSLAAYALPAQGKSGRLAGRQPN